MNLSRVVGMMTTRNRIRTALAGAAMTLAVSASTAQDWPQWRGPNRDGKAPTFVAPKVWPRSLTRKWRIEVGSGDSSPALVGDKLYVFTRQETNEVIRGLEADTGRELWRSKYEAESVSGPDVGHGGPRSSPLVAEGKLIALGVAGAVTCLDAITGKLIWRRNDFAGQWPQFHTAMSPMAIAGLAIVHLGRETDGALMAYDLATGVPKWKWAGEGPAYASPVLLSTDGRKLIVTQTSSRMVAIDSADGRLVWQSPFGARGMAYNAATPVVDDSTVIYSGQGRGTRAVALERQAAGFVGQPRWHNPDLSVAFNSPILKDGLLFGLSQRGRFFCLDTRNGHTRWTEPAGGRGDFGSIIDAGSVLLALTATAELTVIRPSGTAYEEVARFKVSDRQTYAHPVAVHNRIFIKDLDSVALWTIP